MLRDLDPRWRMLQTARRKLAFAHSLEDIAAIVRSDARAIAGADGVTFVRGEGSRCHYFDENAIEPLWKGRRFPMNVCISGWAMMNGKSAAIEDIYADPRVLHEAYRSTFIKSLIMVPVRTTAPVAAIGAYWRTQRSFTEDDVAAIEAMADAVGLAMSTAQAA